MKNLYLFLTGRYKRYIIHQAMKVVWKEYNKAGFTSTGYKVYKGIEKLHANEKKK